MRTYKTLFILLLLFMPAACKTKEKVTVAQQHTFAFEVQVQEKYCGGARVSDAFIAGFETERPYNGELLLLGENRPDSLHLLLDNYGKGTLMAHPGKYKIFFPEKIETPDLSGFRSCPLWKTTPDTVLQLSAHSGALTLHLQRSCNPCLPVKP